MDHIALRAERLVKTFGEGDVQVHAVRGVDLDVRRGELVLIKGPSGSGKTTLLSMLGAMLRPTSGRIVVNGVDLASLPESKLPAFRARRFGFVFQDYNLLGALTAQENVEFALNLAGMMGAPARSRAASLLTAIGLGERLHFRPEKLSGGEKQRVAVARAVANNPAVILADEPTANLDSKRGHEIARILHRAAVKGNRSVVVVSHDERLESSADRVLWLEDGAFTSMSELEIDPICGMRVLRTGAPHYQRQGQTYFFCGTDCREEFIINGSGLLRGRRAARSAQSGRRK